MKFDALARTRLISFGLILIGALFLVRLFYIQIINGNNYSDQADRQYLRPTNNAFDRGSIFFTTKDGNLVSAATLKVGYLVTINPQLIKNASSTYQTLAAIFPLEPVAFMKSALDKTDHYEEIASHIDQTSADKIVAAKLPGVYIYKQKWRFYPGGKTASHLIGFMGFRGDEYLGRYGLEKSANDILARHNDGLKINFFAEVFADFNSALKNKSLGQEGDIVLTIEPVVQNTLEKELDAFNDKWHPDSAGAIILNPDTGEIYAMAATPNFDPNAKQEEIKVLNNPLVEKNYEMGSIFKPLTVAAALDTGAITASTTYNDKGTITLNGRRISNFDFKARGVIPMQEVLNQSLNLGATFAMQRLGHQNLHDYFVKYGLTEKTGIDLPNEALGLFSNLESKREVEYANMSFGQGIAVTPINMARALATLGNGGKLIVPHVIKQINYTNLLTKTIAPVNVRQVLKPATSYEISRMLSIVVDTALAGGKDKQEHYSIAAKTGTAQIAKEGGGGYYEDRYLHSFFGYFPAYSPRFLVFLYAYYPKGAKYASETWTP
ncbi:MAG: penicillin-binding protein 2, partial [Patescibacteria group bacterium]